MTAGDLVQYAKRRLSTPDPDMWADRDLEIYAAIPSAIQRLSVYVMRNPDLDVLLQQDYTVTLDGSGVGNLLTATGSITGVAGELLFEGIPFDTVIDSSNNILSYMPHYHDFLRPASIAFGYYCTVKDRILTRAIGTVVNSPADIVTAASPLTVTASYAPAAVTSIPTELGDNIIDMLVEVLQGSIRPTA